MTIEYDAAFEVYKINRYQHTNIIQIIDSGCKCVR